MKTSLEPLRFDPARCFPPTISTPTHVAGLAGKADGAIVASALVDAVERTPRDQLDDVVRALVKEFRSATAGTVPA